MNTPRMLCVIVVLGYASLTLGQSTRPAAPAAGDNFDRPSLVTLSFKDALAKDVYESLYAQANAKLVTWPDHLFDHWEKRLVTINLDKVPFWHAIDALEAQTGLTVEDIGQQMVLKEAHRAAAKGPVSITGPFMVVGENWGEPETIHRLKVFVEPRIRVLGHDRDATIEEATDDRGQRINIARQRRESFDDFSVGNAFDVDVDELQDRKVKFLRGSVRAVILAREDKVEFEGIARANNVEKKLNGRRFLINAINPEQGDWFVTVIAYNTDPPTAGLGQMRATMIDANGIALHSVGRGATGHPDRIQFTLSFTQGPDCGLPAKLVMEFPVETKEIKIPFEFGEAR